MFECLLWITDQQWPATVVEALGAADLGVAYALLKVEPLTPPYSHQNLHRTGETDSWRAQIEPWGTRTQEKGAMTPQETDPDLPVSVQESRAEAWVGGGLLQGWGQ